MCVSVEKCMGMNKRRVSVVMRKERRKKGMKVVVCE
jgi:hypothetical protein